MNKRIIGGLATLIAGAGTFALLSRNNTTQASDHDDGETTGKARSLNLTDHYAFKTGTDLNLVMNFNPRSLPGKDYFMAPGARYEFHVLKVTNKTDDVKITIGTPIVDDYTFRFEAGPPDPATNVQSVKLTVLAAGVEAGNTMGNSTPYAVSKKDSDGSTLTVNSGTEGTFTTKFFVGQRADSFTFDVVRFFQIRAFLAQRFFGGAGGIGDATATLAHTCKDQAFAQGILTGTDGTDGDKINLWNPPSCAPDFTHGLNVTSISLQVPISQLGGGQIFDTWSTISIPQAQ